MARRSEILFVDPSVSDLDTILGNLRPGVEAIVLGAAQPAAQQIAAALEGRHGLSAVHIIAHGAPGRVNFAAGDWSADTLEEKAEDFAAIGRAIAADGELRLWSCDAAAGAAGAAFIAALAQATGADVAAATGRIGAATRGGSWELTARASAAAALPPLTAAGMAGYAGVLATKTWVTTGTNAWATATNWIPASVPASSDNIVIPGGGTQPTISSATDVTIASLEVQNAAILTFSAAVTLSTGTALVDGGGTIALATGSISASSTITNNGTINGTSGSLTSASTVTNTGSITFTTSGGITSSGGSGIQNSGSITIATGTLSTSASSGIVNNAGGVITMTGAGTLSAASGGVHNTGGTIIADSGGTLTGILTNSSGGLIQVNGGTLTNSGGSAGSINTANIQIASGATLSFATFAFQNNAGGAITISGGALSDSVGISNAGTISGFGTLTGAISGAGEILAIGGILDVANNIGATVPGFQIASGSTLKIDGTVAATSDDFTFQSPSGTLELDNGAGVSGSLVDAFSGTIAGLNVGTSTSTPTNEIYVANLIVGDITSASLNQATDVLTVNTTPGSGSFTLQLSGSYAAGTQVDYIQGAGGSGTTDIFLSNATQPSAYAFKAQGANDTWADPTSWGGANAIPLTSPSNSAGTTISFTNKDSGSDEIVIPSTVAQATGPGTDSWTINDTAGSPNQFTSDLTLINEGQIFVNATNNYTPGSGSTWTSHGRRCRRQCRPADFRQ